MGFQLTAKKKKKEKEKEKRTTSGWALPCVGDENAMGTYHFN